MLRSHANSIADPAHRPILGSRNRWFVPLASLLAAAGSFALVHLAVYLYVATYPYIAGGPPDAATFSAASGFFTNVYHRVVYASLCALASYLAVRYGLARHLLPNLSRACVIGIIIGLLAAAALHAVTQILYPPAAARDTAAFGSLGLAAAVGGAVGGRRALAGDHALRSARADLDLSETPGEILAALAGRLSDPVVEAALWKLPRASEADPPGGALDAGLPLWARYPKPDTGGPRPAPPARLDAAPLLSAASLGNDDSPTVVDVRNLEERIACSWRKRGVRGILLRPLYAPGPESSSILVGMLTVGLGRPSAGRRLRRTVAALAPQAARNLNYMTLVADRSRQDLREKLCTDIHDSVANCSVSIDKQLAAALSLAPGLSDAARAPIEKARENARQMHHSSRDLMRELRPQDAGEALREALASHIAKWERRTEHSAELKVSGAERGLHTDANVALVRVLKEGLTNAEKHAGLGPGCPPVAVALLYQTNHARLIVEDEGVGFGRAAPQPRLEAANAAGGYGLASLQGALRAVGGSLLAESAPGAGTRLVATVPAPPDDPGGHTGMPAAGAHHTPGPIASREVTP